MCLVEILLVVTLEYGRRQQNIRDLRDTHRYVQEMAVFVLVRTVNECLKLCNVPRVGEVNRIDSDVVLTKTLSKTFVFFLLFHERMSTEYNNSRLSIPAQSVLER